MNINLSQTISLQQQASNPKNSAWVFASAGSGKTKILTDRVLRLLLADVLPHKILCLTFTKVAAAEMHKRLNDELAAWVLCDDSELEKKLVSLSGKNPSSAEIKLARTLLVKILDGESKIKVQTIHAFCQSLIKIFPFEAQVRPTFELLESNHEKLLLKRAEKEILQQALFDKNLQNLVSKTNGKIHEKTFAKLAAELLDKKEHLALLKEKFFNIENVTEAIFKRCGINPSSDQQEIFQNFLNKIDLPKNRKLAKDLENSGSSKNVASGAKILHFLDQPILENFSYYISAFFTGENESRKIYGTLAKDQSCTDFMQECRELISDFNDLINSHKIATDSALLVNFIDHILQKYAELKKQQGVLDYDDLIFETNRLLANPDFADWIKLKMDGSFDHILVDESQDTNRHQWNIIKALTEDFFSGLSAAEKNRSIFIVGDEKQSIYSFQGAEPDISSEIFDFFAQRLGDNLKKIELNNSFRSAAKILRAVDDVFADQKRKNAISKTALFAEHKPIRDAIGKVEIWPQLEKEEVEKSPKTFDWQIDFAAKKPPQPHEILAEIIAKKIRHRVENDPKINYGDFMILLRSRNEFNRALIRFFHQYKIPFTSVNKIKFSDSLLIGDLLSVAKFVTLPQDDLNLACLLKSPIFEISETDLLQICLQKNRDHSTIYQALSQLPQFEEITNYLNLLIKKSQQCDCFEFFYFLLHQQNHQQDFIAHFGHEALAILDKFLLNLSDFCRDFSPNLQKFLEFVIKIDPQISLTSEENNRVKISTIHSAKGLQSKIVLLPDCAYFFHKLLSTKEEISWVEFEGCKLPLWCSKKDGENQLLKIHRAQKVIAAEDEYLRLLYVALTRAEDELYIGGFGSSQDEKSWYNIIKNSLSDAEFITLDELTKPLILVEQKPATAVEDDNRSEIKIHLNDSFTNNQNPAQSQINQEQIRGRLIHKIFEIWGKNHTQDKNWLLQLAQKLIQNEKFLSSEEKNKIQDKLFEFADSQHFTTLFSGKVKCEVEISEEIENQKIFKRLDLLVEKDNEILIVDYKSDEILPKNIPQSYLNQLKTYTKLVQNLYPNHQIKSAIFWTWFLKLQICN